jgi:hypothetical protein
MDDRTSEPLTSLTQTLLRPSDKARLLSAAQRRYIKPATLLRIITMEWLDANEPAAGSRQAES